MQKRRLGISLYPERSTFEQDVAYLEKAAKLGFDLLFIALLGAGDRQQTIDRYKPLLAKAKELGSDYIVVGRPITQAEDPVAAYRRCVAEFVG